MKNKYVLTAAVFLALLLCSSTLTSCMTYSDTSVQPEQNTVTYTMPADFCSGYTSADYDQYNSPASENGLGDTPICVMGVLKDIRYTESDSTFGGAYMGILDTGDNEWSVILDYETFSTQGDYSRFESLGVVLCGIYLGFSDADQLPVVMMDKMFSHSLGDIRSGLGVVNVISSEDSTEKSPSQSDNLETAPKPETEKETSAPQNTNTLTNSPGTLVYTTSGKGDSIVTKVPVNSPSYCLFSTNDEGYTSVKAWYGEASYEYDSLVSSTEPYSGRSYLHHFENGEYEFEIKCHGDWELSIYTVGYTADTAFSGSGDYVTDIFQPVSKHYVITYTGSDYFSVKQRYGLNSYDYETLVSETDPYSGTVRLSHSDLPCFFEITGEEGSWTITPAD